MTKDISGYRKSNAFKLWIAVCMREVMGVTVAPSFLTQKWSDGFAQNVFLMFSKVSFNWILLNEFIHGKNDVILANGHKLEKVSLKRFFSQNWKGPIYYRDNSVVLRFTDAIERRDTKKHLKSVLNSSDNICFIRFRAVS